MVAISFRQQENRELIYCNYGANFEPKSPAEAALLPLASKPAHYFKAAGGLIPNSSAQDKGQMLQHRLLTNLNNKTVAEMHDFCVRELELIYRISQVSGRDRKQLALIQLNDYLIGDSAITAAAAIEDANNLITIFTNRKWNMAINRAAAKYCQIIVSLLQELNDGETNLCYIVRRPLANAITQILQSCRQAYIRNVRVCRQDNQFVIQLCRAGGSLGIFDRFSLAFQPEPLSVKSSLLIMADRCEVDWHKHSEAQLADLSKLKAHTQLILGCYNAITPGRAAIFEHISLEIIHYLMDLYLALPDKEYQLALSKPITCKLPHYRLHIADDETYWVDIIPKQIRRARKTSINVQVFNVNYQVSPKKLTVIIEPNSDHYLLSRQRWAELLGTRGSSKAFKLAWQIDYRLINTDSILNKAQRYYDYQVVMRHSRHHSPKQVSAHLSWQPWQGVALNNEKAMHLLVEQACSAKRFPQVIEQLFISTARRQFDAKLHNILFNPISYQIRQIDDERGYTEIEVTQALIALLSRSANDYPKAYDYILEMQAAYKQTRGGLRFYFPGQDFLLQNLRQKLVIYNKLPDLEELNQQLQNYQLTMVDCNGEVWRLMKPHEVLEDKLILVNSPIKNIGIDWIMAPNGFNNKLIQPMVDKVATKYILARPQVLCELHKMGKYNHNSHLILNLIKQLIPLLFPVAPFNIKANTTYNSNLIALQICLTACELAESRGLVDAMTLAQCKNWMINNVINGFTMHKPKAIACQT